MLTEQPSAMPTRKMLAVAIAGVIGAALTQWFDELATLTTWLAWLSSDATKAAVPVLAAFAAGYLVRERAPAEAASDDWPQSQARLQAAPLAVLAAVGLALLLTACASFRVSDDPRVDPVLKATATCRAADATLRSLAALRLADQVSDATADRVNEARKVISPVCSKDTPPALDGDALDTLEDALFDLLQAEQEAKL